MTSLAYTTKTALRDRDLFFHDGKHLRRVRLTLKVQLLLAAVALALLAWSGFATARLFAPAPAVAAAVPADLERLAAATTQRVEAIEHRQQLIAAMLASEEVDPATLRRLIDTAPVETTTIAGGQGGPYEPATGGSSTFSNLFNSWKKLDNVAGGAIAVPSEKPVKNAAFTSAFGDRSDPFNGRRARHMGIDLSGPIGTPIYATADGVVLRAGYNNGGYGNLIELDHGKGITTRYGHLSRFTVADGARVKRGQLIGHMGSTGRSTGSHLHYEVRIDGRAVNPIPFMKSNDYLLAMQKTAGNHAMDAVALGGPNR